MTWERTWIGMGMIWEWTRNELGMNWWWPKICEVGVKWEWSGSDLRMIWEWPGNDVGVSWEWWWWSENGLEVGMWWGGGEKVAVEGRLRQYYIWTNWHSIYIQGLLGLSWVLVAGYQVVVWDQHGFGLGFLFGDPIWSDPLVKRPWMLCNESWCSSRGADFRVFFWGVWVPPFWLLLTMMYTCSWWVYLFQLFKFFGDFNSQRWQNMTNFWFLLGFFLSR